MYTIWCGTRPTRSSGHGRFLHNLRWNHSCGFQGCANLCRFFQATHKANLNMDHGTADGLDFQDVFVQMSREDMVDITEPTIKSFNPRWLLKSRVKQLKLLVIDVTPIHLGVVRVECDAPVSQQKHQTPGGPPGGLPWRQDYSWHRWGTSYPNGA